MEIVGGKVGVKVTTGASSLYMSAAKRLLRVADTLDNKAAFDAEVHPAKTHRAHELIETSLTVVILSFSAVEAVVNELFAERHEFDQAVWFPGLNEKIAADLKQAWSDEIEWLRTIDKAKRALKIAGRSIDWGKGAPQDLGLLAELRNALIHHKPHSAVAGGPVDELEQKLKHRFAPARIYVGHNVNFRWGVLAYGCAKWAYDTAAAFQAEFFGALGCDYPKPWPLPDEGPTPVDLPAGV